MDTDKRSFAVNGITYYINQPSAADVRNSDWNYSKVYSKSLVEGIYTASEMRDILKKRGIIGPEYDNRAQDLADMLESEITKMYTEDSEDNQKVYANKAAEIRNEIFQWNHRLNGPMSNTCEQLADDARLEFLTSCIISNDKEDLVWKDYDSFLSEINQTLSTRSKFEVMLYLQGLESNFLDTVPEAVVLKDIEERDNKKQEEVDEVEEKVASNIDEKKEIKEVKEEDSVVIDEAIKEFGKNDKEMKGKSEQKKNTRSRKLKKIKE